MDPVLIIALIVALASTAGVVYGGWRLLRERREQAPAAADEERGGGREGGGGRVLLLLTGAEPPEAALEAALRLARERGATLVPAYLLLVVETLPLDTPDPTHFGEAKEVLTRTDQRAAEAGLASASMIQAGRSYRHALRGLLGSDRYEGIVASVGNRGVDGLSPHDVPWLLEHADGEVVIVRPG